MTGNIESFALGMNKDHRNGIAACSSDLILAPP
jgi:hypothetical protein